MPHLDPMAKKAYHKEYQRNLSPETKEKNRLRNQQHYTENKDYYKKWKKENISSRLCSTAKSRAKKRGIEFLLNKIDFEVPAVCPILGLKLEMHLDSGAGGKDNSYSLDRIDNTKGYIKGNVQVISHKANSMKSTATKKELLLFAEWIQRTYK